MATRNLMNKYACHFITRQAYENVSTTVCYYALTSLVDTDDIVVGNNIDELITSIIDRGISTIYMQDFTYEASYLISYLAKHGKLYYNKSAFENYCTKSTQNILIGYNVFKSNHRLHCVDIYIKTCDRINVHVCRICSSKAKFRANLQDVLFGYRLNVGDENFDYTLIQDECVQVGYGQVLTEQMQEYCIIESIIIAQGISQLLDVGLNKLTTGSDAIKEWSKLDRISDKKSRYALPKIDKDIEAELRNAYRGGFTWVNPKYVNKDLGAGVVVDVNSLYPYIMYDYYVPMEEPQLVDMDIDTLLKWAGIVLDKHCDLDKLVDIQEYFICKVKVDAVLKDGCIPCICTPQAEKHKEVYSETYLTNIRNIDLWLTTYDLIMLYKYYSIWDIQVEKVYKFKKTKMFNNYVDKYYEMKRTSVGSKRELAKLMLDSLYGRFGIKKDGTKEVSYVDDGGIIRYNQVESIDRKSYSDKSEEVSKNTDYMPISCFITSIGRYLMLSYAHKIGRDNVIYMDTDSIHIVGYDISDDIKVSKNLGDFKIEAVFTKAKYLGEKMYIHDEVKIDDRYKRGFSIIDNDVDLVVKMSGAPKKVQEQVTWENFKEGSTFTGNTCSKQVIGGCIRLSTMYTIRMEN